MQQNQLSSKLSNLSASLFFRQPTWSTSNWQKSALETCQILIYINIICRHPSENDIQTDMNNLHLCSHWLQVRMLSSTRSALLLLNFFFRQIPQQHDGQNQSPSGTSYRNKTISRSKKEINDLNHVIPKIFFLLLITHKVSEL